MPLIQATDLITAGKTYADATDPNAGAWLPTTAWQGWLDSIYAVLYDSFLYSGALTPIPTDTTLTYDPSVGHMTLASASCRALVDVLRVVGPNQYQLIPSAQHTRQYPNLDLMMSSPNPWNPLLGIYGGPQRSWAAFLDHLGQVLVQVAPHQTPDTYLLRSVSDPDVSSGYAMPAVAKDWVALQLARRAFASEGVVSAAADRLQGEADDALKAYLDTFQLRHDRKVSMAGSGETYGSAWGTPSLWWWRV